VQRLAAVTAIILSASAGAANWIPEIHLAGSAGLGYDSNPANAESGSKLPGTGFASSELTASTHIHTGSETALVLRAGVDGQQYFDDTGLSNIKPSVLARFLYRPGAGFFVPVLSAWGSAAAWQFRSTMRSGGEFRGGAGINQQLTTDIGVRLGGYAAERDARASVFELRSQAATLDLDWLLRDSLTGYLGYEFRYGDFAVASPADYGVAAFATAIALDDSLTLNGHQEWDYRVRGHSQIGTLGLNYAFTPSLALDAGASGIHTRTVSGDHYNRLLGEVDVLFRF